MKISIDDWMNFTRKLSKLNVEASELVQDYAVENGLDDPELLDFAYGVVLRYGEASAALSAEMYDEIARLEGKILPDAEVAETPTKNEVAKAVNGTKKTGNPKNVGNAVGRLVKRTGADTMLKNAARDGAQFAWIPSGDTCPFCLMLASNGWQYMSKKALKNGHAEHIHANCDCTYCIRFDKNFQVEGYNPDKYLEMYYAADGATIEEKANSIRRQMYAQNKEKINAQKRANYAEKKQRQKNSDKKIKETDVTEEYKRKAQPKTGDIIKPRGFEDKNGEEKTAKWLHELFGGQITLLPETAPEGKPNPDYRWNGKFWDLMIPETPNGLDKRVRHGVHQIAGDSGGIIIDIKKLEMDEKEIERRIRKRISQSAQDDLDVIICNDSELIKVIRYKKK